MTLLELLKKNGRLELSLKYTGDGDKVAVNVSRGGELSVMIFEDVRFATGGALTLAHLPGGYIRACEELIK